MVGTIVYQYLTAFLDWLNTKIVGIAAFAINFVNDYVLSFFEIRAISLFMDFSMWLNLLVFGVCFIVVAVDIAEEKVSGKPVYYAVAFSNMAKAFIFALCARWIGIWSMEIAYKITTYFGLSLSADKFVQSTREIIETIITDDFEAADVLNFVFTAVILIAVIIFAVNALKRSGEMFIHIFTSVLYISDIMRGDTSKMGDWIRQMLSITLTYLFVYILFFLGCGFFNADNLLFCLTCWLTMPAVSKILNKYGWSSGSQGNLGAMAIQTGALMIR